jgi:MarR family 2-MHQ and catechol resistance regulon transcriptional repressor
MNKQIRTSKAKNPQVKAVHLWLVLWKAARALETYARNDIEKLGLCQSDFGALEALLHKGPLTINALGAKVLLTSGSITTAVDRLEAKRLVERRNDPADRRARIVRLTPRGQSLIRKLFAEHERSIEHAVKGLAARECETLTNLLKKLGRGIEDVPPRNGSKRSSQTFED